MELYLRYEHGSYPVHVINSPYLKGNRTKRKLKVSYPTGDVQYDSFRSLLIGISGKPTNGLTFDRYFRISKSQPDYIIPDWGDLLIDNKPKYPKGINLKTRHKEVEKLMYAGFGKIIYHNGYDPEDVLQEVYRGILARNKGKCPWDKNKSTFGHYVHMVIGCILKNYHRKRNKWNKNEQYGVRDYSEDGRGEIDVACSNYSRIEFDDCQEAFDRTKEELKEDILHKLKEQGEKDLEYIKDIIEYLALGHTQLHISQELNISRSRVSKLIKKIRSLS